MKEIAKVVKAVRWNQYFAASVATIGGFGLGTVLAWSAPALPSLEKTQQIGYLDNNRKSWIGSFMTIGALLAGPMTGYCMQKYGRKTSLIALSIPFFIGWILIATATTLPVIYTGRILTGLGGGGFSLAAPIFITEISEESNRGALGSLFQLMLCVGKLFSYFLGEFFTSSQLAFICAITPVVYIMLLSFLPETPIFLLREGKSDGALKSLCWLRGTTVGSNGVVTKASVEEEFQKIQKVIVTMEGQTQSLTDLLSPHILKSVMIMVGLMLLNQFSGVNAVSFYNVEIFKKGGDFINPNSATTLIGLVQVVATVPASILVDRCGRKILLVTSFVTMHMSLVALAIYFYLAKSDPLIREIIGWLPVVSLIMFSIGFSIGIGPCCWVIMGEILPNEVVGSASAIATSVNWISAFIVTKGFESLKDEVGEECCFGFFAICCALGILFTLLCVPETKGKTLGEIQEYLQL